MKLSQQVTVYIVTRTVGQNFGTCGVVRRVGSGRKVAETEVVPYGFSGAAHERAETIVMQRGWQLVTEPVLP